MSIRCANSRRKVQPRTADLPATKAAVELIWTGKDALPDLRPQGLIEDPRYAYGAVDQGNLLIQGDNLPALLALQPRFANRIDCIYIDPPYNTGATYTQYGDDMEHAAWLSMMRPRLSAVRDLLSPRGVLFVSIDDGECAYLTVLLDEIFGRENSCGRLIWERKKKPSFLDGRMAVVTESILAYARDRSAAPAFIGGSTTPGKRFPINNAGNSLRTLTFPAGAVRFACGDGIFEPADMSHGRIITRLLDRLEIRDGRNVDRFRLLGEWRYSQAKLDAIVAAGEEIFISRSPFRPNHIKADVTPKKLKNLLTIAGGMATNEDATEEGRRLFGHAAAFTYPKPEKLIATLIAAVTREGDWILDAFAGSGTTGAVAHKMNRRWIMIEQGEHCLTHIVPRMRKVIDGADPGGITAQAKWTGGGGFGFASLLPID